MIMGKPNALKQNLLIQCLKCNGSKEINYNSTAKLRIIESFRLVKRPLRSWS